TGGGGFAMLAGAPVVYDKQQEIRQLLVDEVRRRGTIAPSDYFHVNWRVEPASAVASLYRQMRRDVAEATSPAAPPARATSAVAASDTAVVRATRPAPRLRIIATNDFHGALEPRTDPSGTNRGGAAYLATALTAARAGCIAPACETILVDAGDQFQGTPASNLAFGRPVVAIFNDLGYAAAAVGNHEFDWGQDTLRARMREAHYHMLAANVRYADGRDVPWIPDDTLVTRGAIKIGIIGVATIATPTTTRASNVADLRFVDPVPIVDSLSRRLRARGADYVVLLAHAGAFCDRDGASNCNGEIVDVARRLREPVDAIVSGHTHSLVDATVNGIPIVQARSSGTAYAVIDLAAGGSVHRVPDVLADSLRPDAHVDSMVRVAVARVAPLVNRPVATIARDLVRTGSEYPLGDLIADAMRSAGHGDIAVINNGGIRTGLRAGQATYGSLFEVQPFANQLSRVTLTGFALRGYLERQVATRPNVHVSGLRVTYDTARAAGSRIVDVRMADGSPLRDEAHYHVIVPDFLATGGAGVLGATPLDTQILPIIDLDALIAYLQSRPQPVQPPTDLRFIAVAGGGAR
ncbi:MAG TPA: 5'-nucleotidase C-terminal domain-containing protein, partial [Gemmatimonadaceae bacterium]